MIGLIINMLIFLGMVVSFSMFMYMLIVVLGCVLSVLIHVIKH